MIGARTTTRLLICSKWLSNIIREIRPPLRARTGLRRLVQTPLNRMRKALSRNCMSHVLRPLLGDAFSHDGIARVSTWMIRVVPHLMCLESAAEGELKQQDTELAEIGILDGSRCSGR